MKKPRQLRLMAGLAMLVVAFTATPASAINIPGAGGGGGCMAATALSFRYASINQMYAATVPHSNSSCTAQSFGDYATVDAIGWRDVNYDYNPDVNCGEIHLAGYGGAGAYIHYSYGVPSAPGCGAGRYAVSSYHQMWRSGWLTTHSHGSAWADLF